MRPWAGCARRRQLGAGVRFAILPQVLPNFLSYSLLRFEMNVRAPRVIGFVGAGGIGQELYQVISFNYYQEIGAILVLIMLAVSLIDLLSERLRVRVIGALRDQRGDRGGGLRLPAAFGARPARAGDPRSPRGWAFARVAGRAVGGSTSPPPVWRAACRRLLVILPPDGAAELPARNGRTSCKGSGRASRWRSSAPSSRR